MPQLKVVLRPPRIQRDGFYCPAKEAIIHEHLYCKYVCDRPNAACEKYRKL